LPVIAFNVVDQGGKPISVRGRVNVVDRRGEEHVLNSMGGSTGRLSFLLREDWKPRLLRVVPVSPGYWPLTIPFPEPGCQLTCELLPSVESLGGNEWWWHDVLNASTLRPLAGNGIKVGVVDTAFRPHLGLDHVRVVTYTGEPVSATDGTMPAHGEIICRIIGQRRLASDRGYGLAPAAQLTLVAAENGAGQLDLNKAVLAVRYLAHDCGVDLLNISAGLFDNPLLGLRSVIRAAAGVGTLCIVAAGNDAKAAVAYPARYPDCVGVGAIGLVGWGPPLSTVRRFGERDTDPRTRGSVAGRAIFHFPLSAFGEGLDMVAPGVGIVVNRGGPSLFVASGTSYAAPMVCGLLAAVLARETDYLGLPRDLRRAEKARSILEGLCVETGLAKEYEGLGMPRGLPVA
jgi:hypothetical protein